MKGIPLSLPSAPRRATPSREESPGVPGRPRAGAQRRARAAGACAFKGPASRLRRPRRRDVPGPPRPEAARFLPGGATAPEQLRRRRRLLGAGGAGCSAGAAASSRSPSSAAQGKGGFIGSSCYSVKTVTPPCH